MGLRLCLSFEWYPHIPLFPLLYKSFLWTLNLLDSSAMPPPLCSLRLYSGEGSIKEILLSSQSGSLRIWMALPSPLRISCSSPTICLKRLPMHLHHSGVFLVHQILKNFGEDRCYRDIWQIISVGFSSCSEIHSLSIIVGLMPQICHPWLGPALSSNNSFYYIS